MLQRLNARFSEWTLETIFRSRQRWQRLAAKASDERGAMTIEYILIIALIAIIIITVFTVLLWPLLRPAIVGLIDRIVNAINGGDIS